MSLFAFDEKLTPFAQVESSVVRPSWKGQKIWLGLSNIGFSAMLLGMQERRTIFGTWVELDSPKIHLSSVLSSLWLCLQTSTILSCESLSR